MERIPTIHEYREKSIASVVNRKARHCKRTEEYPFIRNTSSLAVLLSIAALLDIAEDAEAEERLAASSTAEALSERA